MTQVRLFFAVDLPKEIKREVLTLAKQGEDNRWRWTPEENIHLTLIFLGYLDEGLLPTIIKTAESALYNFQSLKINCQSIIYGPENVRRMIWLMFEKNSALEKLKNDLENALLKNGINFKMENREFKPHITLARLKSMEQKPKNKIEKNYQKSIPVEEIALFMSELKPAGAQYTPLQKFQLK